MRQYAFISKYTISVLVLAQTVVYLKKQVTCVGQNVISQKCIDSVLVILFLFREIVKQHDLPNVKKLGLFPSTRLKKNNGKHFDRSASIKICCSN